MEFCKYIDQKIFYGVWAAALLSYIAVFVILYLDTKRPLKLSTLFKVNEILRKKDEEFEEKNPKNKEGNGHGNQESDFGICKHQYLREVITNLPSNQKNTHPLKQNYDQLLLHLHNQCENKFSNMDCFRKWTMDKTSLEKDLLMDYLAKTILEEEFDFEYVKKMLEEEQEFKKKAFKINLS